MSLFLSVGLEPTAVAQALSLVREPSFHTRENHRGWLGKV